MMTKVSIIIPVYNAQNTIIKALTSVKEQSFPHYEIIIVNDGSSDSTDEKYYHLLKLTLN
ncbi:glycosyltransferase family 2 protein [Citrobacter freundii]|uniref:glycosyltransferase family 2 protein n=1 Tax=Citrobacter freundii TaxID=546 RepID=UPI00388F7E00